MKLFEFEMGINQDYIDNVQIQKLLSIDCMTEDRMGEKKSKLISLLGPDRWDLHSEMKLVCQK